MTPANKLNLQISGLKPDPKHLLIFLILREMSPEAVVQRDHPQANLGADTANRILTEKAPNDKPESVDLPVPMVNASGPTAWKTLQPREPEPHLSRDAALQGQPS